MESSKIIDHAGPTRRVNAAKLLSGGLLALLIGASYLHTDLIAASFISLILSPLSLIFNLDSAATFPFGRLLEYWIAALAWLSAIGMLLRAIVHRNTQHVELQKGFLRDVYSSFLGRARFTGGGLRAILFFAFIAAAAPFMAPWDPGAQGDLPGTRLLPPVSRVSYVEFVPTLTTETDGAIATKLAEANNYLLNRSIKFSASQDQESLVIPSADGAQLIRCEDLLPTKEYLELLLEVGNLCVDYGDHVRAEELYSTVAKVAAKKLSFAVQAGSAFLHSAELSIRQARWTEALRRLKESKRHFTRARYQRGLAQVENHLGVYYAQRGDTAQARQHLKRALAVFEKANDIERMSTILMDLGILSNIAGDWEEALSNYQRALPEFEKAGSIHRLAELHHNMAMTLLAKRDYRSAVSQFDESLTYANQLDYQPLQGLALLGKATAYARMGDHPLAMAFANRALNIFRQTRDHLSVADSYKVKAIVQRELNNLDVAELYLQTSIRLNQQYENALNLGESYFELGLLHSARNQPQKASEALRRSAALFKRVGARHELTAAQQMMMQLKK